MLTTKATVTASGDNGGFKAVLSTGRVDRDGEALDPADWAQPLPDSIPIGVDHSMRVGDLIGSARPYLENGRLMIDGTFADTPNAQHTRALVNQGHLGTMSVEFLRHPDGRNELVGGSFVHLPANPDARVLASKAPAGDPTRSLIQGIHDAAAHLGAQCAGMVESEDVEDGATEGANKAAGLSAQTKALRMRLEALGRPNGHG